MDPVILIKKKCIIKCAKPNFWNITFIMYAQKTGKPNDLNVVGGK